MPQGCEGSLKLWRRHRRRFLNRLLSLPCARQNLLFNYFAATLAAEIRAAKAEGRYFEGMSELAGVPKLKQVPFASLCMLRLSPPALWLEARGVHGYSTSVIPAGNGAAWCNVQEPDVVWTDRNSGLQTLRNILQVDRGMSYEVRAATHAAINCSWAP